MSELFRDLMNQGVVAAKAGNRESAEQFFRQAIQENPRDPRGWYYFGVTSCQPAEARKAFEMVLALEPHHEQARARLQQLGPAVPDPFTPSPEPDPFAPPPVPTWDSYAPPVNQAVPIPRPSGIYRPAAAPWEQLGAPPRPPQKSKSFMVIGFLVVLLVGVTAAVLTMNRVFGSKDISPELKAVLDANIEAMRHEDLSACMDTLHPDSPAYDQTESMTAQVFDLYTLEYDIEKMELVSESSTVAKVRVVQVTRKVSGPAFQDNRLTAVHELRKYNGEWRIYNSYLEDVEYLN